MIRIKEVRSQKDYQAFADLAKDLYQDNPYWVQPIRSDYLKYLQGQNNGHGEVEGLAVRIVDFCPSWTSLPKEG